MVMILCVTKFLGYLLDSALKDDFIVSVKSVVVILIGNAGTGKTSFKRLLLRLPPQEDRTSTDLAEAAIRRVSFSTTECSDSELKELSPQDIFQYVAEAIAKRGAEATSVGNIQSDTSCLQDQSETSLATNPSNSPESAAVASSHSGTSSPLDKTGADSLQHDPSGKELSSLLDLIAKSEGSGVLLNAKWVYIIDTGGQPQFLQLLPAFIKNISSCVCFIKLDENLDNKSSALFYDSGKQLGDPYKYTHTNLQLVESCVSTIKCCSSEVPPEIFIIGTHNDLYNEVDHETKEVKESKLNTVLKSLPEHCTSKGWIHPIDCKNPKQDDLDVIDEFRKCVVKQAANVPTTDLPIMWFILEQCIRQHAKDNELAYVHRDFCMVKARELRMDETNICSILEHLVKLNIFRCYQCLPELIFIDNVVLEKITELVKHSYELKKGLFLKKPSLDFMKKGIVSKVYLSSKLHFTGKFTLDYFLQILRELLVIADFHNQPSPTSTMGGAPGQQPLSNLKQVKGGASTESGPSDFFMPCLLEALSEEELRASPKHSESLPPLLICFKDCLPNGLFTSLIVSLMKVHCWKFSDCLVNHRNCIKFGSPNDLPGSVTLVSSFTSIEIHLKCNIKKSEQEVCECVLKEIKCSLESSWKTLYPSNLCYDFAFFCSKCLLPDPTKSYHPAIVNRKHGHLQCCEHGSDHDAVLVDIQSKWLTIAGQLMMHINLCGHEIDVLPFFFLFSEKSTPCNVSVLVLM